MVWAPCILERTYSLGEDIVRCRFRLLLHSNEPGCPPTPYSVRIQEIDG